MMAFSPAPFSRNNRDKSWLASGLKLSGKRQSKMSLLRTNRVCSSNIPYRIETASRTYPVGSLNVPYSIVKTKVL